MPKCRKQTKTLEKEFNEAKFDYGCYKNYLCNPNKYIPEKLYKYEIPSKRDVLEMFHFYTQEVIEEEIPKYIDEFNSGEMPLIEFLDTMVWLREEYISRLETTDHIISL